MNAITARSKDSVDQQLDFLLKSAELNVLEFDIHRRNEMSTFNRIVPFYVMSYHKVGRAKLRVGDRHYDIEPGTVICLPPNVEHDHYKDTKEETEFLWWHFTYDIAGVMDVLKMFDIPVTFRLKNTERFEEVFHQFVQCTSGLSYLPHSILKQAKALELLYLLLENALSKNEAELTGISSSNFLGILSRIVRHPEQPGGWFGKVPVSAVTGIYIEIRYLSRYWLIPPWYGRRMASSTHTERKMTGATGKGLGSFPLSHRVTSYIGKL